MKRKKGTRRILPSTLHLQPSGSSGFVGNCQQPTSSFTTSYNLIIILSKYTYNMIKQVSAQTSLALESTTGNMQLKVVSSPSGSCCISCMYKSSQSDTLGELKEMFEIISPVGGECQKEVGEDQGMLRSTIDPPLGSQASRDWKNSKDPGTPQSQSRRRLGMGGRNNPRGGNRIRCVTPLLHASLLGIVKIG